MTVSSQYQPHSYKPGAAMAPEAIPFEFIDAAHIVVTHVDAASGVRTTAVSGTDYLVSGDGPSRNGAITAARAFPADDVFIVARATAVDQPVPIPANQPMPSSSYEQQLDRMALVAQEREVEASRSPQVPVGATAPQLIDLTGLDNALMLYKDGKLQVLDKASFAGKFVGGDAVGSPVPLSGTGSDAGLRGDLASNVGTRLVLAADGKTVQQNLDAKTRTFEQFLPADYDYTADDCSAAIVTAAQWSADNNAAVSFSRRYRIANAAVITTSDFHFDFQNAQFDVRDDGSFAAITNGASGPIGILVQLSDHPRLTGSARFVGLGETGTTRLAGLVIEACTFAETGDFYFENMAAGLFVMLCQSSRFGNVTAHKMDGAQTFSSTFTDAGTAVVSGSNENCSFGNVHATLNHKPILYCSIAAGSDGILKLNKNNSYGFVSGTSSNSATSSMLGIRNAVGCTFAGATGVGFSYGAILARYATDTGLTVDRNTFGPIQVELADHGSSGIFGLLTQDDPTAPGMAPIGRNRFTSVTVSGPDGSAAGANKQIFGALISIGAVDIDNLYVDGCYYGLQAYNSTINVGKVSVGNNGGIAVRYGLGVSGAIQEIEIRTSPVVDPATAPVTFNSGLGSGPISSFTIGSISRLPTIVGTASPYVFFDGTNSPGTVRLSNVIGSGTSGQARWLTDTYSVRDGRLSKTTIPTGGSWTQGDVVWNSGASAGGVDRWQRLTTGTGAVLGVDWSPVRSIVQQTAIADLAGAPTQADFNGLLAKLRAGGVLAT